MATVATLIPLLLVELLCSCFTVGEIRGLFAAFLLPEREEYVELALVFANKVVNAVDEDAAAVVLAAVFSLFALLGTVFFPFGVTLEGVACEVRLAGILLLVLRLATVCIVDGG